MAGEEISPELRRFIETTINSVEQLEVLLFLMSNPEREWSADEIAARIRATRDSVSQRLVELHRAHLLQQTVAGSPTYRYAPASPKLAEEIARQLEQAYREKRDTLLQLIYSRPLDNIKIFADAFRIKRRED